MRFLKIKDHRISIDSITCYEQAGLKVEFYFKDGVNIPFAYHSIRFKDEIEAQHYVKWLDSEMGVNGWDNQ